MGFKELLQQEIELEKEFLKQYQAGMTSVQKYHPYRLSQKKDNEYYITLRKTGKIKYLSKKQMGIVAALRKFKLCQAGITTIEQNLKVLERLKKIYKTYDPASLQESFSKAYRPEPEELEAMANMASTQTSAGEKAPRFTQSENPYHPEHLKHITSFGLVVRSRIEAAAAELAYSRGYYIMYEKRVILYDEDGNPHVVYPDFILCENAQSPEVTWIYWEHLGLLDMEDYRERTMLKLKLFPQNGILPGRNLILTTDGMDQSIDLIAVRNVLDSIKNLEVLK